MKEIFEQYGQAIIAFVVVILIISILVSLLSQNGVVAKAFEKLLNDFFVQSNSFLAIEPPSSAFLHGMR